MDIRGYHALNSYIRTASEENALFLVDGDYMDASSCWKEAMRRNENDGIEFADCIEWMKRIRIGTDAKKKAVDELKFNVMLNNFVGEVFDWYEHDAISNAKWLIGVRNSKMDYNMNVLVAEDGKLIRANEQEARDYWGCTDVVCYNGTAFRDIDFLNDGEVNEVIRRMGNSRPSGYAAQYWDRCVLQDKNGEMTERQWLKSFSSKWCKDIRISI